MVVAIALFLFLVWFPSIMVLGWKLKKMQGAFMQFLTQSYPERWREVLRRNPFEDKSAPGFTSLTFCFTKSDLDDNKIKRLKSDLKRMEALYFSVCALFPILFLLLYFLRD